METVAVAGPTGTDRRVDARRAKQRMREGAPVPALEAPAEEQPISHWLTPMVIEGETIDAPRREPRAKHPQRRNCNCLWL